MASVSPPEATRVVDEKDFKAISEGFLMKNKNFLWIEMCYFVPDILVDDLSSCQLLFLEKLEFWWNFDEKIKNFDFFKKTLNF